MNRTLLLLPLVLATAPRADAPLGAVEAGTRVRRALAVTLDAESRLIEQFVGDESQEADGELGYRLDLRAEWRDTYAAVDEDGRPTALERIYTAATRVETNRFGGRTDETEGTSPLVDERLRFERDDDGDWEALAPEADEDFDRTWLEQLDHDADLAFLIADGSEEPDASWEVDVAELRRLLRPTGELHFASTNSEALQALLDEATEDLWDDVEGELSVGFVEAFEDDGRRLTRFRVEAEAEGRGEAEADLDDPDQEGASVLETGLEVELEGELWWDPAAGHAVRLELAGEIVFLRRQGLRLVGPDGQEIALGQYVELEGEIAIGLTTEALADGD